jgi:16S rRNA (guanine(966)-N(2))-methyltransferase RsmD
MSLRPTPDRLRETLFNVLGGRIEGSVFLDAYAGSGAVGIEALSRGAVRVIFIEDHPSAVRLIRENLRLLGVESHSLVVQGRAAAYLGRFSADIVFLDPPYEHRGEYEVAMRVLTSKPPRLVIAQHPSRLEMKACYGPLWRVRILRQGDNALSFYEPTPLHG